MPIATASDGAEIFYSARGEGHPLVLSNPSFSSYRLWERQAEALAKTIAYFE